MSDWDFFFCEVDGQPCAVVVDLELAERAPVAELPWLLSVRVPLLRPRPEDGLARSDETADLGAILDALEPQLEERCGAVHVGRLTTHGRRELYFHGRSMEQLGAVVSAAMRAFPQYQAQFRAEQDPSWKHYREVLFPSPPEAQWIADRKQVDALREQGDVLGVARSVDHTASFERDTARDAFAKAATARGFGVAIEGLGVRATRRDAVTLAHIHEVSTELLELAEEHGGRYLGWGTPVVRG